MTNTNQSPAAMLNQADMQLRVGMLSLAASVHDGTSVSMETIIADAEKLKAYINGTNI